MKRVLITGANSYVGINAAKWLSKFPDDYSVEMLSVRDESWAIKDFSKYDVVLHTAGIAHIKETKNNASLYYKVNRDLAYEVANKARNSGVEQFIFLSSMSVYGIESGEINRFTKTSPKSHYGKSKLQAEELIGYLKSDSFKVAILRPPMIYGKGCPGNFNGLIKIAKHTPIFPDMDNRRSMLHINNLSEFLRLVIKNQETGLFFPQNQEFVNVSEMVKILAQKYDKKITLVNIFNPLIKLLIGRVGVVNKVFGNLVYEIDQSKYPENYSILDFTESIKN
ncbi:NAD-dependent epimerase/dehydratase family protein [Paenibacillus sp. LHD-117]|uniref:NAD-dependent epimerase/dehydratase family protein n=1 Tax=Paenibacillus sp. LHD-117 TaxID=3071412 RepID=UPI0027E097D8|nr:NAD-dependent epimerase/dehydratase family protein [Paenibacillus sp. LHD-117]MDQ6420683.1 NAD-dependent epimerase/dehydratase family protein [Paenibacillus sp. LHD-117]